MALSAVELVTDWTIDPASLALSGSATALYAHGVRRLRRAGRAWPRGRTAAFAAAIAAVVVATSSGLAVHDTERFAAHAGQHVLLGMVAPLLLALAAPVTLALQASRRPTQVALRRLLGHPTAAVAEHPLLGWALFGGALVAGYFTPVLEASLRHDVVHVAVHGAYLGVGYLFFWPLVGTDPSRWRLPHGARLLLVLLAVPFHAFVGVAMLGSRSPLAPGWYGLGDQRVAGGIIWVSGALVGLVAAAIVLWQWLRHEEAAARREDRRWVASPPAPTT